jgi:NAD(P)-dependent dehydrogenase (short-subunit alcohol dehydrogenase family)
MTVYVTARDKAKLADAAREVTAAGGEGIAVVCDHADDRQVKALFDRIGSEQRRLDLVVNNAAAVYPMEVMKPGGFWQKDLNLVDMIAVGLRSDYVACYYAVPLMIETGSSLIANISFYGAVNYFTGPAYVAAKAGTDKMTHDMGIELRDTPVSIVSVWPGFVLTDMFKELPQDLLSPALRALLPEFETPEFTGLVIAALLDDPELKTISGKTLIGAELGRKYGIKDLDGKQPRDWTAIMGRPHTYGSAPSPLGAH